MKRITVFYIIFINIINVYSQIEVTKSSTTLYPYDGNISLIEYNKLIHVYPPISFKSSVSFINSSFDSLIYFRDANFSKQFHAINCSFNQFSNFIGANFLNKCLFIKCKFNKNVSFENSKFKSFYFDSCIANESVNFNSTIFDSISSFQNSTFNNTVTFYQAKFINTFDFSSTTNKGQIDFRDSNFKNVVYFEDAIFNGKFFLSSSTIENSAYFNGSNFKDIAEFYNVKFIGDVYFSESDFGSGTVFGPSVNFDKCKFEGIVDFRSANFERVEKIHFYGLKFQNGKLLIYWEQLKGDCKPKITLSNFSMPRDGSIQEYYRRIETIYLQLRDNFIAQGDRSSADNVMYELSWQKKEILGGLGSLLYGWFLGWGYQPWRFIIFVILPLLLLFAYIWYVYFYPQIVSIVWDKIPSSYLSSFEGEAHKKEKKLLCKKIKVFDHKNYPEGNVSTLARIFHVLHFSASVLLGIRFKKEWIETSNKLFLRIVTIEWFIGILCYIIFAIMIKSERFSIIKGLFGF